MLLAPHLCRRSVPQIVQQTEPRVCRGQSGVPRSNIIQLQIVVLQRERAVLPHRDAPADTGDRLRAVSVKESLSSLL